MNREATTPKTDTAPRAWYLAPTFTAPILVLAVLVFIRISAGVLSARADIQEDILLILAVVQVAVIVLPCALYYLAKGRKLATPAFSFSLKFSHIVFILFTLLMFISGTILIKYLYIITNNQVTGLSGYFESVSFEGTNPGALEIILSLVIVPAISEEILFRGIILSEYRSMGSVNAVIMSALCFSMMHLSLANFPIYFFTGLVLGFTAVITRSILGPIILHIISNFLSIYGSDVFLRVTIQKSGVFFVGFVIATIFMLSLVFVTSKLERIYFADSIDPPTTSLPPKSTNHIAKVFLSPTFLVLAVVFIIAVSVA